MTQLRQQEAQSRESAARENERARLAGQKSKATALVAAGEAGVSGNSVDALLQEYDMQFGQFREATLRQQKITGDAIGAQVHATQMGANNQGLSINAPIERPSWGVAGLRFASDALTSARAYDRDLFAKSKTTSPGRG